MPARAVSITGLTGPGYQDTKITIGDVSIPTEALAGVTIRADVGGLPTLTLDVLTLDISTVEGQMEILIPDATHAALTVLGWTPPSDQ